MNQMEQIDESRVGVDAERAVYGGLLGVAAMTVWIRAAWLLGFPPIESGSLLGSMLIGNLLHTDPNAHFILGALALALIGTLGLALLYAEIYPHLPSHEPILNGVLYALVLWIVGQLVVAPLLGTLAGLNIGLFSLQLGPAATVGTLIAHLLYGLVLGAIYGHHYQPRHAGRATG